MASNKSVVIAVVAAGALVAGAVTAGFVWKQGQEDARVAEAAERARQVDEAVAASRARSAEKRLRGHGYTDADLAFVADGATSPSIVALVYEQEVEVLERFMSQYDATADVAKGRLFEIRNESREKQASN